MNCYQTNSNVPPTSGNPYKNMPDKELQLLVAIAAQILSKNGRDEQASFVTIAGMIVVFFILIREIGSLFDTVRSTFGF